MIRNYISKFFLVKNRPFFDFSSKIPFADKLDFDIQNWALKQSDDFSADDWREVQLKKLKEILIHAGENVAYWRNIFKQSGFSHFNFQDFSNLEILPISSRSDLARVPFETRMAKNLPLGRCRKTSTSGSTAEPIRLFQDVRELAIREAGVVQEFRYNGLNLPRPGLILGLKVHWHLDRFGTRFDGLLLENYKKRRDELYPLIKKINPEFAISTPSLFERLMFFMKKDGFFHQFRLLRFTGENLIAEKRNELQGFFKCRIFSLYGAREASIVGIECLAGNTHLAPWLNYVEILNENGKNVSNGQEGEIVITYFENKVMPFIRYNLGDKGFFSEEKCKCGRNTKIINFSGRKSESISTSSGLSIPVLTISSVLVKTFGRGVSNFQIEQKNSRTIVMQIVPSFLFEPSMIYYIKKQVVHLFKNEIDCEVKLVDFIPIEKSGKARIFIKSF